MDTVPATAPSTNSSDPFAKAPSFADFDVDFGFLSEPSVLDLLNGRAVEEQARPNPPLLAVDYRWKNDAGRLRIPLPLCEFLAYKAALVARIGSPLFQVGSLRSSLPVMR